MSRNDSKQAEMGRKRSQTVAKPKQVAIDKKQMSGNDKIKVQKIVPNRLAKDSQLNIVFKLVFRLSKAIHDTP